MSARLLSTELRRFFARRAIILGLLGVVLLVVLVNAIQLARSTTAVASAHTVQTSLPGQVTMFSPGYDRRIHVAATFEQTISGAGIALTLLVAFLASTYIAADYGTSLATQLLFEPRRRVVYVTKAVAAAIGCAMVTVVVLLWCGILQYAGSALRGISTGVDAAWVGHRLGDIARAAAASAMMAVLAFAIGAVTRRTAAAIGVLFGLLVAMQFLRATKWTRAIGRIVPVNAIWGVADGKLVGNDHFIGLHTLSGAVAVGLAWVAGLTVLGAVWFARREIR